LLFLNISLLCIEPLEWLDIFCQLN
jgi:hypothetical protein